MNPFQEGRNITELFQNKLEFIRKKLAEYDYKQLREFSTDEIESFSMLGHIEDMIVDFENPVFSTRLGKMTLHPHIG